MSGQSYFSAESGQKFTAWRSLNVKVTLMMIEMMVSMIEIDVHHTLQTITNAINEEYNVEIAPCMICRKLQGQLYTVKDIHNQ